MTMLRTSTASAWRHLAASSSSRTAPCACRALAGSSLNLVGSAPASSAAASSTAAPSTAAVAAPGAARLLSTTARALKKPPPSLSRPAPPSLPPEEQREMEKLIREKSRLSPMSQNGSMDSEELHPHVRRKPDPDFEGDTNPLTGEVGGPKKDPLAWQREWTYGGRATDF